MSCEDSKNSKRSYKLIDVDDFGSNKKKIRKSTEESEVSGDYKELKNHENLEKGPQTRDVDNMKLQQRSSSREQNEFVDGGNRGNSKPSYSDSGSLVDQLKNSFSGNEIEEFDLTIEDQTNQSFSKELIDSSQLTSGRTTNSENDASSKNTDIETIIVEDTVIRSIEDDQTHLQTVSEPRIYYPALQGSRSVTEYAKLNRIEEGTFGVVFRATNSVTKETVALKRLKMENEHQGFPITSLREINALLRCNHPNIVTVKEVVVGYNMNDIYIVMEYVEHDLKSLMDTMNHPFLLGEVKTLMIQLLRGIHHLHDNWILHRDLKPSNLLLSHNGILKIGDFGLAREYGSPLKHYTPLVMTLWYRSPELLLESKTYSTPIDLWSCGALFAEFMTKKPLFRAKDEIQQIERIFEKLGTPNDEIWPGPPCFSELPVCKKVNFHNHMYNKLKKDFGTTLSETGYQLLNSFLTYDPARRITAEDALKHRFFQESPLPVPPSLFPTWPAKSENAVLPIAADKKPTTSSNNPSGSLFSSNLNSSSADPSFYPVPSGGGFNLRF